MSETLSLCIVIRFTWILLCYCNNLSNWGNSTFLWLWTTSVIFVFIWCCCICRFVFIWSWYSARLADIHMQTGCRRAAATICPLPSPPSVGAEVPRAAEPNAPADCNVAVGSHSQCVPTLTAAAVWHVNAAVSKAAWWPWPWKWCPSHMWRGLPLPILVFLGLSVLDLGRMYATERRQTASSLNAPALGTGA